MIISYQDILEKWGNEVIKDMKQSLPKATGKTQNSLELKTSFNSLEILGAKHIGAIINGRKPTSSGAVKGNPTLQESILEWIEALSIQPKEANMSQLALSWAISKSIHKKGYKGKGDIFKGIFTDKRIEDLEERMLARATSNINEEIFKTWQ